MEEKTPFSLWKLFSSMFVISAVTFGGGYVIVGMMRKKYCNEYHWVTDDEVLDMTAIAQSAPGPLAVNSAIIFGYRLNGVIGALISALAVMIPPVVIILVIAMAYNAVIDNKIVQIVLQVMRAGVGAIITDVVIDMAGNLFKTKNIVNIGLMIAAFIASWFCGISSIAIILFFICLGLLKTVLERKKAAV